MAKWIRTNGECLTVKPANGRRYTLEELQGYVGGYIELVRLGRRKMWVNEEGRLKELPVNLAASKLYHRNVYIPGDTPIVGDVLVVR